MENETSEYELQKLHGQGGISQYIADRLNLSDHYKGPHFEDALLLLNKEMQISIDESSSLESIRMLYSLYNGFPYRPVGILAKLQKKANEFKAHERWQEINADHATISDVECFIEEWSGKSDKIVNEAKLCRQKLLAEKREIDQKEAERRRLENAKSVAKELLNETLIAISAQVTYLGSENSEDEIAARNNIIRKLTEIESDKNIGTDLFNEPAIASKINYIGSVASKTLPENDPILEYMRTVIRL